MTKKTLIDFFQIFGLITIFEFLSLVYLFDQKIF